MTTVPSESSWTLEQFVKDRAELERATQEAKSKWKQRHFDVLKVFLREERDLTQQLDREYAAELQMSEDAQLQALGKIFATRLAKTDRLCTVRSYITQLIVALANGIDLGVGLDGEEPISGDKETACDSERSSPGGDS